MAIWEHPGLMLGVHLNLLRTVLYDFQLLSTHEANRYMIINYLYHYMLFSLIIITIMGFINPIKSGFLFSTQSSLSLIHGLSCMNHLKTISLNNDLLPPTTAPRRPVERLRMKSHARQVASQVAGRSEMARTSSSGW